MTTHFNRIEITTAVAAFGLGSLLSLLAGCSSPASAAAPEKEAAAPVRVSTVVAEVREVPRTIALTGTLVAARAAQVAADGAGRVMATMVDRGDTVEVGAPIARLDARSAALVRAEAGASARALLAQEQNAKLECNRAAQLFAVNVISRAELERISTSCQTSTHSVDAARAREGMASKALGDAVIRAPFRGVVVERLVDVGDYVAPGRTVVSLVDASSLKLEVAVPETAIPSVAEGKLVFFDVAAYPDREFSGHVTRQARSLRPRSRDEIVEVAVENADGALRPGMFASARLVVGTQPYPVVPRSAVAGEPPNERVFVVTKESKLEERVVATGAKSSDGIAVTKGLSAGERVARELTAAVRDGVRVTE